MFCILLRAKLAKFFGAGPVWFVEADSSACSEHWWTNLLYLNNFLKTGEVRPAFAILPMNYVESTKIREYSSSYKFDIMANQLHVWSM